MTLSERSVKKPTTVAMIFILLVAFGIFAVFDLAIDMFPDMEMPYVAVYTTYKNAGPEEVEQSVTRVLESSLSGVSGLKRLQSQSSTGASLVMLEMNYGVNLDEASGEIRDKIDLVRNYLPDDAESPVMIKMDPSMMPIMKLSISGNRTPEELRRYSEDIIQKRLEQIDGIASANISGGREKCIRIDIPRDRLEAYSLTVTQVSQMLATQNIQTAGGKISTGDINYTIQSAGKYRSLDDIRNTVISWKPTVSDAGMIPQIRTVQLKDIADVYEGYKEEASFAYMNGKPCVAISLQRQSGKNSVEAAEAVRKQIKKIKKLLPDDIKIEESWNTTDSISATIKAVVSSVIEGALLAILVLVLFLRSFKSTFIIGISIPVSIMVTLCLMWLRGMTLNMMSLAGLLIGVGMLVDNSIVVLENIYSYRQRDAKPTVAAILGSQEMVAAITSSTLTTVCIFVPMLMLKSQMGMVGQFLDDLSMTIIFSLMCSLVVAITLVPVLASSYLVIDKVETKKDDEGKLARISNRLGELMDKLDIKYSNLVKKVLYNKKKTILVLFVLFLLSFLAIWKAGFVFMPESESPNVSLSIQLPRGTRLEATELVSREFEAIIAQEVKGVKHVQTTVGGSGLLSSSSDTNKAEVNITLYPAKERKRGMDNAESCKEKLRKYFNQFPGATITFSSGMMNVGGQGVIVKVQCDDLEKLGKVTNELVPILRKELKDVANEITSNLEEGLPEVKIIFDRERMYNLGLNIYSVGAEIKANIDGVTASRYEDAGKDIDMVVSLAEQDKARLTDLDSIFVTNSSGLRIPLSSFAKYEEGFAPVTILRQNQARMTMITIKPKKGLSLDKVQKQVDAIISENIPQDDAVTFSFMGDNTDFLESLLKFGVVMIMAAALVFAIMASQFESFKDPFIVIFTIPLSFIGVAAIYLISGQQFSIVAVMGFLMLIGMIVNNGIVLVDYTNLLRKRGYNLFDACVESARSRLRPIVMSTLTTIISLVPMAFFPSEGTEIIQPISMTVLGGLSFGSIMTLVLMPILYYIFNSGTERKIAKVSRKLENCESDERAEIYKRKLAKLQKKYEKETAKFNEKVIKSERIQAIGTASVQGN